MRVGDRRRAESIYIVASGVIALVLVLSQYASWAIFGEPERMLPFVAVQVAVAALYAVVCLLGRQPRITVTLEDDAVRVRCRLPSHLFPWRLSKREEAVAIPLRRIRRCSTITAELYYRHHARYAGTRAFVNRIPPRLLLLDLPEGPVVIGLEPVDLSRFLRLLEERTTATSSRVA